MPECTNLRHGATSAATYDLFGHATSRASTGANFMHARVDNITWATPEAHLSLTLVSRVTCLHQKVYAATVQQTEMDAGQ